jgi:hypothetical protein
MKKQKMKFTNRKSEGDRNLIWYVYFLIYRRRQKKSGGPERAILRQDRLKIPRLRNIKRVCI